MWSFFHKLGSPPGLYAISGTILRWLLPMTLVALFVASVWGLLYTAPDFRQGNSYRIIYIHVPAAVVALALGPRPAFDCYNICPAIRFGGARWISGLHHCVQ